MAPSCSAFATRNSLDLGTADGQRTNHIAICICTYKRPQLLNALLQELREQETDGLFSYSIVVVDNDPSESARPVVAEASIDAQVQVDYQVEPRQSIAMARNKAVQNAVGDFIAFIDDDELPTRRWLLTLFQACRKFAVDGVLGPVKPCFTQDVPTWLVTGRFYDRPSYPTGYVIDGPKGRTGNVLLRKTVFSDGHPFRPEFQTGEDQDFFARMIEQGKLFVWCHEAVAYEAVPPARWKRSFLLRRALLRGQSAVLHPGFGPRKIMKSVVAIFAYTATLPVVLFLGHHRFMNLLVRLFAHIGKVLALMGIKPIRAAYITE